MCIVVKGKQLYPSGDRFVSLFACNYITPVTSANALVLDDDVVFFWRDLEEVFL